MTFVVPNYFLEQQPHRVITAEELFSVTYSSRKNNDSIAVRNTTHVMIMITKGRKKLKSYNAEYDINAGDILLLTQGNYFMSEIISDAGEYEAIMIYFDDDFIAKFVSKYKINFNQTTPEDIAIFHTTSIMKDLVTSYKRYLNQNIEKQNEIIKLKTQEIFLHLLAEEKEHFVAYLYAITSTAKDRIRHILEANLDIIESVEDMCRIARVSKSELRNTTQNAFGMLPKAWLAQKRLEQAALLLKTTDKTITDIATSCGFSSLSWFGVQFKKRYGCTPKDYAKSS